VEKTYCVYIMGNVSNKSWEARRRMLRQLSPWQRTVRCGRHLMMTPHTSAVSDRLWKRQTEILAELLERWFGGRELFNRIDLSRGY